LISQSTVSKIKKKINETGQYERKAGTDRSLLLICIDISYLKKNKC